MLITEIDSLEPDLRNLRLQVDRKTQSWKSCGLPRLIDSSGAELPAPYCLTSIISTSPQPSNVKAVYKGWRSTDKHQGLRSHYLLGITSVLVSFCMRKNWHIELAVENPRQKDCYRRHFCRWNRRGVYHRCLISKEVCFVHYRRYCWSKVCAVALHVLLLRQ